MGNKEKENNGLAVVKQEPTEADRDPKQEAIDCLDDRERAAYEYLERSRGIGASYAPVAPQTNERFFKLYCRGLTCEDIRQLNPGFGLGQIVEAKVLGGWEERRQDYDLQLVTDGRDAMARAQMEVALLASDTLSVAAMVQREKLHKYTVSRNEKDIEGLEINLKSIAKNLELLLVSTRQEALPGRMSQPQQPVAGASEPNGVPVQVIGEKRSLVELAALKREERKAQFALARKKR